MTFDTLQYIDQTGTVQEVALSLSNPAFAGPAGAVTLKITPKSHAPGECVIAWALPPENGMAIPFRSYCIVYAGRQSATGGQNSFSGGSILFQGRRWDNEGLASRSRVSTSITLLDAWKELEKITFQIVWLYESGGTLASPSYSDFNWPDVVLMQPAPNQTYNPLPVEGAYISTWQQIQDIFNYAKNFMTGANALQLQLGTLQFTPAYCNWYPVRSQKCADCLKFCLRPHPGVYTEIDYTTTPPTLHFRNVTTMVPVMLPYKSTDATGAIHLASDILSLDELKPDAVRIYYRINATFNGQPVANFGTDIYPPNAPNSLLCLDYSLDLTGSATTETVKNFTSNNFSPTDIDPWRTKVPALRQVAQGGQIVNDGSPGALQFVNTAPYNAATNPKGFQVIDENGNAIDYTDTFLYWTDESVYEWFNLGSGVAAQAVKATVRAFFTYQKVSPIGGSNVTDTVQEHEHQFRIMLTNAPSNDYYIKQTQPGEAVITGLAQSVWTELQPLQWKLRHEIIQVSATPAAIPNIIKPGKNCINLSGGNAAWATMNAVPENVSIDFFRTAQGLLAARHVIQCGPVNHLEPQYLTQLANLFWNRNRSGINPNQRLTGNVPASQVDLTATDSRENSTQSTPVPSIQNVVSVGNVGGTPTINGQIIHDATAINSILVEAGGPTPYSGFTETDIQTMKPREIPVCDPTTGETYYMIVHCTGGYSKS